jgi:hypothetical protein
MLTRVFLLLVMLTSGYAAEISVPGVALLLQRDAAGKYAFVVRNTGATSVFYSGFGGKEASPPIFGVEILQDEKWTRVQMGWCGTGLAPASLRPNGEFTQSVHPGESFKIGPGEKFRVTMSFAKTRRLGGEKHEVAVVHSNPIAFVAPR